MKNMLKQAGIVWAGGQAFRRGLASNFNRLGVEFPANEANGGGRGIRTPDTLSGIAVFKTACFNRSHIPPQGASNIIVRRTAAPQQLCPCRPVYY
jgi:hypothetical protein